MLGKNKNKNGCTLNTTQAIKAVPGTTTETLSKIHTYTYSTHELARRHASRLHTVHASVAAFFCQCVHASDYTIYSEYLYTARMLSRACVVALWLSAPGKKRQAGASVAFAFHCRFDRDVKDHATGVVVVVSESGPACFLARQDSCTYAGRQDRAEGAIACVGEKSERKATTKNSLVAHAWHGEHGHDVAGFATCEAKRGCAMRQLC